MRESALATLATFLLFLCTWTTALPSKTAPISTVDIEKAPLSMDGPSSSSNPPGSASALGEKEVPVELTSFAPPDHATLDTSYQEKLTLSFDIKATGVRRARIFVQLVGGETANKFVIRGASDSYALSLTNVPPGTYYWRFEIVTDSTDSNLRKQKFGPWEFTVGGESISPTPSPGTGAPGAAPDGPLPPTSITPGLQSDCLTVDPINYNICLDLKSVSGDYEPWMDDFGKAKLRWQSILKDDGQSPVNLDAYWKTNREWIATSLPPLVDDLYISGFLEPYDGVGEVLGMAAPYLMRTDPKGYKRPIAGYMYFDSADEAWLRKDGIWTNTILHEMGHVLGLGTMWRQNGLHSGSVNDDKYRTNSNAEAAWEQICPGGRLPVETFDLEEGIDGGTAGGHWDEDCLANELMTGFVSKVMPLSNITIASLADMGYTVNYSLADPFGRADLGDCGDYCPGLQQKRWLRGTTASPERRFRNKISANGHKKILKAAAKHMQKLRSSRPASLPSYLEYYGGEQLTVYLLDEDGDVKDETVSWEEAKQYATRDIAV